MVYMGGLLVIKRIINSKCEMQNSKWQTKPLFLRVTVGNPVDRERFREEFRIAQKGL